MSSPTVAATTASGERLHDARATFVARPTSNTPYEKIGKRTLGVAGGDGFVVLGDADVRHAPKSRNGGRFVVPMYRIRVHRYDDKYTLVLITDDLSTSALEIGAFFNVRCQIELLFRWVKQKLKLKRFLGNSNIA